MQACKRAAAVTSLPAEPVIGTTEGTSSLLSPWIGPVEWLSSAEIFFPAGVPGFENHRRLIPVEIASQRPIVYLQSAHDAGVCFVLLPVLVIDPAFKIRLNDEDLELLGLDLQDPERLVIGEDILCLALLTNANGRVETDLASPFVVGLRTLRGIQAVSAEGPGNFVLSPQGRWIPACS